MFRLQFRKSNSKFYAQVVNLASNFYIHSFDGNTHVIDLSVKELFEKWDYFNSLFWKVENWKGSTFGYDDFDLHSLCDRKRLFYALQEAHNKWLCLSESYMREMASIYYDDSFDDLFRDRIFNEEDVDRFLDLLNAEKYRNKFKSEIENE